MPLEARRPESAAVEGAGAEETEVDEAAAAAVPTPNLTTTAKSPKKLGKRPKQ